MSDLVLIGYEPKGSENLSLRLLAGTVADSGYSVSVMTAAHFREGPAAVDQALHLDPRVLGFSLQDAEGAVHAMALAILARRRGFKGFIVCGGTFATLQPDWVLGKSNAVDGVIRHDGEGPLISLLSAVRNNGSLEAVSGLTTRHGTNLPTIRQDGPRWRPLRGPRPEVMGIKTADILGSRGCPHQCDYCTHAATAALITREHLDAGLSPEALRKADIGTHRRRDLDDLTDEMATLYHDDGVRYFQLMDENPVPENETDALVWIRALKRRFEARGISDLSFGCMMRGDALTPKIIDGLVEIGLIRAFVGAEAGTSSELEALGRRSSKPDIRASLAGLGNRGVVTLFNSLIIHPASTAKTIGRELDYLSTVRGALFDTIQTRPFAGTRFYQRIDNENRLVGGRLIPTFRLSDPDAEQFRSGLLALQLRVLGDYTPTFRLSDLLFSAVLRNRHCPTNAQSLRIERMLWHLVDEINNLRVEFLRSLLNMSRVDALRSATERTAGIAHRLDALELQLRNASHVFQLSRCYRNVAAAAGLLVTMVGAPGCYGVSNEFEGGESLSQTDDSNSAGFVNSSSDSFMEAPDTSHCAVFATDPFPDEPDTEGAQSADSDSFSEDSDPFPETDTHPVDDTAVPTDPPDTETCNRFDDDAKMFSLMTENCEENHGIWQVYIDENGNVTDVVLDDSSIADAEPRIEDQAWVDEMIACYLSVLQGETFPCFAGEWVYKQMPFIGIIV